jgi:polyribonucleotide nucleotidyltransferase
MSNEEKKGIGVKELKKIKKDIKNELKVVGEKLEKYTDKKINEVVKEIVIKTVRQLMYDETRRIWTRINFNAAVVWVCVTICFVNFYIFIEIMKNIMMGAYNGNF